MKAPCPNKQGCKLQADPNHSAKYTHDVAPSHNDSPAKELSKIPCPQGIKCLILLSGDTNHTQRFSHNGPSVVEVSPAIQMPPPKVLAKCPFGFTCEIAKTSPDHATKFDHNGPPTSPHPPAHGRGYAISPASSGQKPMCSNPYSCPMTSDISHKQQYRHFCKNGRNCRNINDPVHQDRFVH